MFNNSGNNSNNKNVNTKIRTLYGETACLQLAYWNENISIKVNPLQSVNAEGMRQYDYSRRASTALSTDKCAALAAKIEEVIFPAIQQVKKDKKLDNPVNTGLHVGNKGSAIFVEYKNDDNDVPSLYLTVYTNIGQDGKAPKDGVYSYKFSKVDTIDNYDPETGTGTDDSVDAEFMFFYEKIKNITDISGAAAHSINVDMDSKTNAGNRSNNNNNFSNNNNNTSSNYSAPVNDFNMDGGLPF